MINKNQGFSWHKQTFWGYGSLTVMDMSLFCLNRSLCIFQLFLGHLIYKLVYIKALVKYILLVNFFLDLSPANVFLVDRQKLYRCCQNTSFISKKKNPKI